ncbi:hypothetical protein U1Q18_041341 [Sarracenia purpurea var. burkii]
MLKALMFVAVYSIGVLFDKESFKFDTMASMLSISVGVAIATYGDAKFDSWGVLLHLDVVAFEVTPFVLLFIFFSILLRLPTSTLSLVSLLYAFLRIWRNELGLGWEKQIMHPVLNKARWSQAVKKLELEGFFWLPEVEFNREAAEVVGVASARRKKKSKSAREKDGPSAKLVSKNQGTFGEICGVLRIHRRQFRNCD